MAESPGPPLPPEDAEPAITHYVNLTIAVADPAAALGEAERILHKLGGEVTYASGAVDNANLNGRIPVAARHQLRDALGKLGALQNENSSSSDITAEVRRLQRRLFTLQRAELEVAGTLAGSGDVQRLEVAALLRELTDRERQSIEASLQGYALQTRDGQVNVAFVKTAP
jgi:hypothetical protein